MPDRSPRLDLPYLMPAQAQKHVTHNQALQLLDAVTQLSVRRFDDATPPVAPAVGDIHALGPLPTGVWAGQAGKLALWEGTAWIFVTPAEGWRAWGIEEQQLRIQTGAGWQIIVPPLQNLPGLGIGTTSDPVNRLAVTGAASLLSHAGAGHQVKVNKAAAGDTASLLFQSNWAGHAEIGLAGNNSLAVKVSADGSAWVTPLVLNPVAQTVALAPAGIERARLSDSALQLDVPLTGTAVQASATDAAAGRLLKVGAFGLGDLAPSVTAAAALDGIAVTGYVRVLSASVATVGGPSGAVGGVVQTTVFSTVNKRQSYGEIAGTAGRRWERYQNTTWSAWRECYRQDRILGTVAQAGGIPTGAVIERGSNANGEYVRLADGTQICTHEIDITLISMNVAYGALFGTAAEVAWTFPAAFAAAPAVSPAFRRAALGAFGCAVGALSALSAGLMPWSAVTMTTANKFLRCTATGRWF